jgi:hypothetical protein
MDAKEPIGEAQAQLSRDASLLLDHAITTGTAIPADVPEPIRRMEALVSAQAATQKERSEFEKAYRELAEVMRPVSAETLRATMPPGKSRAARWSLILWGITIAFLALIGLAEILSGLATAHVPVDAKTEADIAALADAGDTLVPALAFLLPFLYGGLGACTYLLRSCHRLTFERKFNPLREGEYMNRILLGLVAGGSAGGLFHALIVEATTLELGTGAVAFLAGYSTDFLFTTLERVIAAVLPKVEPARHEKHEKPKKPAAPTP